MLESLEKNIAINLSLDTSYPWKFIITPETTALAPPNFAAE
jgi:hypothetical protein